ncbi:MAG: LysM domain-containing protein [Chloroflexota bacterium]
MDDQAAQEEVERLRQEIQEIDRGLTRLGTERRLFGRSSFSPEWLILRQRALQMERERCQSRLRELARAGQGTARLRRSSGESRPSLKATVYALSAVVVVLVVAAFYLAAGQGRTGPAASFTPTPSPTATPLPSPTATPTPGPTIYTVVPGDTLYKIAQQYSVTIEAIVQANKLQDPRMLRIGQELIIPPAPTPTPTAPASPGP